MIEKIFKIGVLFLLGGFLFVYYTDAQIGRYKWHEGRTSMSVFDSQTGILYTSVPTSDGNKWFTLDVVNRKTDTSEQ